MDEVVAQIVRRFDLKPHPEGGYFREVYRSETFLRHPGVPASEEAQRRAGSLIYFLLEKDDFSAFHRVKWTDEIWHVYGGGPIELHIISEAGEYRKQTISADVTQGEPTFVVPAGHWQAARVAQGAPWALGGCTVAPGFEFADFEMPPRADLIAAFPGHAEIINQLTRT